MVVRSIGKTPRPDGRKGKNGGRVIDWFSCLYNRESASLLLICFLLWIQPLSTHFSHLWSWKKFVRLFFLLNTHIISHTPTYAFYIYRYSLFCVHNFSMTAIWFCFRFNTIIIGVGIYLEISLPLLVGPSDSMFKQRLFCITVKMKIIWLLLVTYFKKVYILPYYGQCQHWWIQQWGSSPHPLIQCLL